MIDYLDTINRLAAKGYSSRFLSYICQKISQDLIKDRDLTIVLSQQLEEEDFLLKDVVFDEEHNRYELLLKDQKDNGFHFKFNWELLTLPEFQRLLKLDQELDELNRPFFGW